VGAHQQWLAQAGVALTPWQFWAGSVLVGVVALVVGSLLTGAVLIAAVPAVAVALIPRAYFARRRATRMRAVQEAWPDGLRDVVASIAAGRSLTAAVAGSRSTGRSRPRSHARSWRRCSTTAALESKEGSPAPSDRAVEVLILASEPRENRSWGSPRTSSSPPRTSVLGEIRPRARMKISARAVLVLPWLVLVALTVRDGAFETSTSRRGLLVVVGRSLSDRLFLDQPLSRSPTNVGCRLSNGRR
jgi:hypothetical protein